MGCECGVFVRMRLGVMGVLAGVVGCARCVKGTFRENRVIGALNFHKIRNFCILVMVLDV